MINRNTIFLDGRKIGTYKSVFTAGTGHIEFDGFKPYEPTLNENQQIVLEYLKTQFGKHEMFTKSIFNSMQDLLFDYWNGEVNTAFEQLDLKQEIQVLEVFGQWTLEQEEE